ncbi:MAG: SRPBCC domain-containing protein [Halobacteriota archaeon]
MKQIRSEIEINASAERVWHVLTDFAGFPQWNPFIRQISGELKVGGKLDVYMQPSGQRGIRFRPVVLAAEPSRELRWLGRRAKGLIECLSLLFFTSSSATARSMPRLFRNGHNCRSLRCLDSISP